MEPVCFSLSTFKAHWKIIFIYEHYLIEVPAGHSFFFRVKTETNMSQINLFIKLLARRHEIKLPKLLEISNIIVRVITA